MISERIGCDVHRIEAVDSYPDDYRETVERNVRGQEADARPAIANPLDSIKPLRYRPAGHSIWNVRAPMIMTTFGRGPRLHRQDRLPDHYTGMSGLGTTVRDFTASCPGATIGEGLAVRGEEVRDAGAAVEAGPRRMNLLKI